MSEININEKTPQSEYSKYMNLFCDLMNAKAAEFNMNGTVYRDPAGIDNRSTARDMLRCLIKANENEVISQVWSKKTDEIHIKGSDERVYPVISITLNSPASRCLTDHYNAVCGKGGTLNIPRIFNSAVIVRPDDSDSLLGCVVMGADDPNSGPKNRFAAVKAAIDKALKKTDGGDDEVCATSAIVCRLPSCGKCEPEILYEKAADRPGEPASMSKMMTSIVALEHMSPDTLIEITPEMLVLLPSIFYQKDLHAGDRLTLREMICAMMLPSSNIAAYAVGCTIGKKLLGKLTAD